MEIPEEYKVIRHREPFLMHDSGAQDDKRILIYTTYDSFQYKVPVPHYSVMAGSRQHQHC